MSYEVTGFSYDAVGNLIPNPRVATYSHDAKNRMTSTAGVTYAYDADGNVITKDAPRPNQIDPGLRVVTTYLYDVLHRVTSKSYSDGTPSATFVYDTPPPWAASDVHNAVGRLILAQGANGYAATLNSYDVVGRVATQWQCTPYNCGSGWWRQDYTYNFAGGMTSYTNGMGVTFTQSFNGAGQVTQVTSSLNDAQHPGTLAHTIYYTPAGAQNRVTFGNGLVELRWFNNRQQPWQLHTFNPPYTGTDVLRLDYTYAHGVANNGNVQSWEAHGQQSFNRSYIYDELNRVQSMSGTGGSCTGLEWTYDIWGNRTNQTTAPGGGSCPEHHPVILTNNRISGLTYDAAGNVTFDPASNATYTYDAENRMISSVSTLGNASYVYDANGQRVQKAVGGTQTNYIYGLDGKVVAEVNGSGGWDVGYVYLNGQMLAQYKDSTTYFAHLDHLGSTRLLTMVSGSVWATYEYLPFGEQIAGGSSTTHKFTGKERDAESGLDFFGARYYGSSIGRFLSADSPFADQDPANPQTWNLCAYVLNNPLRHIDPDGEGVVDVIKGIAEGTVNFVVNTAEGAYTLVSTIAEHGPSSAETTMVIATPMLVAAQEYGQRGVSGVAQAVLDQGEQGATAVVTHAVLTGGLAALGRVNSVKPTGAGAEAGPAGLKPTPPGENAAAAAGRAAHAELTAKVNAKPGWQSQPRLTDPKTGNTVKPDVVTPSGRPLEYKPSTPSGRAQGQRQLPAQERATGKKGRVIYYEPEKKP